MPMGELQGQTSRAVLVLSGRGDEPYTSTAPPQNNAEFGQKRRGAEATVPQPLYCPWPRAFLLPRARPLASRSLWLRRRVCGATMTTPGVARTTLRTRPTPPCSAHRLLSWGRSLLSLLSSGPSLCPTPISPAATKTTRAGVSFGVSRPST
jgi:hypothetical protein